MSAELKPCPFCGGAAVLDGKSDYCRVRCETCCTEGSTASFDSENADDIERAEAEAITAWNRRPPAPAAPRTELKPMGDEPIRQWYFDCDGHYIDVVRDEVGSYSIYFRDRATNKEAWLDQADQPNTEPPTGELKHEQ